MDKKDIFQGLLLAFVLVAILLLLK